jgi:hypothetical protein
MRKANGKRREDIGRTSEAYGASVNPGMRLAPGRNQVAFVWTEWARSSSEGVKSGVSSER